MQWPLTALSYNTDENGLKKREYLHISCRTSIHEQLFKIYAFSSENSNVKLPQS